ncbi:MAG: arsenic efflux protein [Clostridia bacterium]|nr:arsenic efflux protein [Clostridia bacterium]
MHTLWHIVSHALLDSAMLLPFLFLTYLFMELLEHKAGDRLKGAIARAGRLGPLFGGLLGLVPQYGFSALAAGLFAGRIVSPGTLLAVFLATSDEMLPIFLGAGIGGTRVLTVLGIKLGVAVLVGFLVDLLLVKKRGEIEVGELCDEENCHCGERGVWLSALLHTVKIFAFVLAVNLALTAVFELVGEAAIASVMSDIPVVGVLAASLIGLIPNCAASVLVATLWTKGVISGGAMLGGLLTGAGAGLLVLFRTNRHQRENLLLLGILFGVGAAFGILFDLTGLSSLLGL